MVQSVVLVRLKSGAKSLFIELDFNGAGVLADACVCACCHGFQLSSGAVQRERAQPRMRRSRFHPTSDLLLWTNCRFHPLISIPADWAHRGCSDLELYKLFFGVFLAARVAAGAR